MEIPAVPICPIHHRSDGYFLVSIVRGLIHAAIFIIKMGMIVHKNIMSFVFFFALVLLFPLLSIGAEQNTPVSVPSPAFRSTALPLPRFVSLGSDQVFVRTGPGQRYPVKWEYKKKGLPVEIVLEYDIWRKIRDFDGQVGWVHHTLLNGKRMAFILGRENVPIRKDYAEEAVILAYLEPKTLVEVKSCAVHWCRVDASGYKGWLPQNLLWGVYESESFD